MSDEPRPRSVATTAVPSGHLAVLDASPNAIVAVGTDGLISYANRQADHTFGYDEGGLVGLPVELLIPVGAAGPHQRRREVYSRQPTPRAMGTGLELAGRKRDGREFPVEIGLTPVETPDGHMIYATIVDITARKALEAQLLQAQKLESIGRLAGGIAHDFNNMLFAIRGYAEMLEDDLAPEHRATIDAGLAHSYASAIGDVVERATLLTRQLLAFGRRGLAQPKVLDINESASAMETMLGRLIGDENTLVFALDETAGRIRVDPSQLDQILLNLVVNARDAMPDGGRITIATGNAEFDAPYAMDHYDVEAGSYVMVAVSDTGTGMDSETRARVFEPFFTTKDRGKGTGLGLATIYGIVRQAGGHVWVYSEPGRGSTFKIYFPREDAPAMAAVPAADEPGRRGTLLVVEDEPTVRAMTTQILQRAGWEVVAVPNAGEALTLVDTRPTRFDAIVSDVVMPGMSGIELAGRVLDRDPQMRIVLLSGYTAETLDLAKAVERGVRFVPKPLSSRQLLAELEQ
ncbi:MAG: ATP-binding protein [Chloroflexota bacterium]